MFVCLFGHNTVFLEHISTFDEHQKNHHLDLSLMECPDTSRGAPRHKSRDRSRDTRSGRGTPDVLQGIQMIFSMMFILPRSPVVLTCCLIWRCCRCLPTVLRVHRCRRPLKMVVNGSDFDSLCGEIKNLN